MFKRGEIQDVRQKGCAVTALALLGGLAGILAAAAYGVTQVL